MFHWHIETAKKQGCSLNAFVQSESIKGKLSHQLPCFQRAYNGPVATNGINEEMLPAASSDSRGAFRSRGKIPDETAKKTKCIPGITAPPDVGPHDTCLDIHNAQKLSLPHQVLAGKTPKVIDPASKKLRRQFRWTNWILKKTKDNPNCTENPTGMHNFETWRIQSIISRLSIHFCFPITTFFSKHFRDVIQICIVARDQIFQLHLLKPFQQLFWTSKNLNANKNWLNKNWRGCIEEITKHIHLLSKSRWTWW